MSDEYSRVWKEINDLSQHRVRTDERISSLERRQDEVLREVTKAETRMISAVESLGDQIKDALHMLTGRMDSQERVLAEKTGEERGRREARAHMFKVIGAWVAIIAAVISLLAYLSSLPN